VGYYWEDTGGENEVIKIILSQCKIVQQISHMECPGMGAEPSLWGA